MSARRVSQRSASDPDAGPAPPSQHDAAALVAARAVYMLGADAERAWTGREMIAWEGLLAVARQLRRGAEQMLGDGFELTISMLGITGRLSRASAQTLRQTALAEAMGLSLSRVSRVIDLLEQRGLVERHACPADARATNATLTPQGAALTVGAQHELFAYVQSAFFANLDPREVETLAAAFTRLLDLPAPAAPNTLAGSRSHDAPPDNFLRPGGGGRLRRDAR